MMVTYDYNLYEIFIDRARTTHLRSLICRKQYIIMTLTYNQGFHSKCIQHRAIG